jgi:vacuolar-type H+-ATPase subunit D/Vma8
MTLEEKIKAVADTLKDYKSYDGYWIQKALISALEDYDHEFVESLGCIDEEDDQITQLEEEIEKLQRKVEALEDELG